MLPRDQAEAMAEEVGVEYGRTMAEAMGEAGDVQRSFRTALHAVADALSSHGFAAHAEQHGDELRIVSDHCPFGDAAIEHPVICAVDRGMVRGMLEALYGDATASTELSRATGADICVTHASARSRPPPVTRGVCCGRSQTQARRSTGQSFRQASADRREIALGRTLRWLSSELLRAPTFRCAEQASLRASRKPGGTLSAPPPGEPPRRRESANGRASPWTADRGRRSTGLSLLRQAHHHGILTSLQGPRRDRTLENPPMVGAASYA